MRVPGPGPARGAGLGLLGCCSLMLLRPAAGLGALFVCPLHFLLCFLFPRGDYPDSLGAGTARDTLTSLMLQPFPEDLLSVGKPAASTWAEGG